MNNKLYVSNLAFGVNDQQLNEIFSPLGNVISAKVITDRDTGRSKGFGFVEFESEDQANEAITKLNGSEQLGRRITVAVAKPQAPRDNSQPRPRRSY